MLNTHPGKMPVKILSILIKKSLGHANHHFIYLGSDQQMWPLRKTQRKQRPGMMPWGQQPLSFLGVMRSCWVFA